MPDGREIPEPTELVYVPAPAWPPVLLAAGLAAVLVGLFTSWPYSVAGAVVALPALWSWARRTGDEVGRLPREQRLTTAVLPAAPLRPSRPSRY